ncbi:uncharacterized protein LOC127749915 [Frankliniella occidentalis]|uniref:DNA-directed DNA polymerase n=1 Tax=Frankliniella occidentalis TaxID=133901 RepID=A0A9C6UEI4_FRAOC|nr:uncharacterized protein LOC127749915 [Frankliniella occidentalis]
MQTRERVLKRFKDIKFREEVIVIKGLGESLPSEALMTSMFDKVLERQRTAVGSKDDDMVVLEIANNHNVENPLWFSMRRADQLSGQVVIDKLSRVLNSNQQFFSDGQMTVSYIHVPTPEAGGRRTHGRSVNETMDEWLKRKSDAASIWSPQNTNDSMCLTRSVSVAIAKYNEERRVLYKIKKDVGNVLTEQALYLCQSAGIDSQKSCGLAEVARLQEFLKATYRIIVFTDKKGKDCVYKGDYAVGLKNIYLLLHKEHFSAIMFPRQAFDYDYDCEKCAVFFNKKGEHQCQGSCWRCFGPDPHDQPGVVLERCGDCGHQFAGPDCLENHKTIKLHRATKTKCETFKFCALCSTSYSTQREASHVCNTVYCQYCKHNVRENHLCYMTPWSEREKRPKWKYLTVYYDFECSQVDPIEGKDDIFEHKPNLLVTQTVCDQCKHIDQNEYFCENCQNRQHIFHNLDDKNINVVQQFLTYLKSFPAKTEILLVAHNAKAYDVLFILQELIAHGLKPEITLQGAKIICLKIGNFKFIDSLMFLPMPLAAMPKSFGLTELKKGHWCYLANRSEFYSYVGPMLDKKYYCSSGMKDKAYYEFEQWYKDQVENNYVFNFRKELIDYCISDVTILRQACQSFRSLFSEKAGFDPMFNCISLSGACMAAFRRNFLQKDTIGIVPPGGYHGRGKQSHVALQWLDYESFKLGETIKTIHTDREVSVLGRRVDGYVEISLIDNTIERRIYQFHGCYWHHCPKHYPSEEGCGVNRFQQTQKITQMFRTHGYKVIEKWECDFKWDMENDPDVKNYFESHPTQRTQPLNLRDALAGGRTSAFKAYYKANLKEGEKIMMVDVISEYPAANLRGKYSFGHPRIFLEGDPTMPDVHEWNGVIKATLLPPRDLFIPVLPYKCGGKLHFPLCRLCAETESEEICSHDNPEDRQLTGTWCAPEIKLAVLEKSYQLSTVHEVYQYPGEMKYNPETGEDGLLSAYVRCFMALKIQASGWPENCDTPEAQQKYVEEILKCEGITIDPNKMEYNPALRQLSKLMLNSFWGKFGEKCLRSKTEFVYDYGELMHIISDPKKIVQTLLPLSETCLQVSWKPVNDSEESLPTSSLLHAAFTTCHGRMQLYQYLDTVRERAIYADTDSCAYISRPGEPELRLGTHLGDLTDQVSEQFGPGSFILEMVCAGPKNYSYLVAKGGDPNNVGVVIKVRGININKSCDQLVTFHNLKAMVLGQKDAITVPIPRQIARLPGWRVVTRDTSKKWQAKNSKRRRVGEGDTVPHGYNRWLNAEQEDQALLEALETLRDA